MAQKTTRRELRKAINKLDEDGRKSLLKHAEKLAGETVNHSTKKSLADGDEGLSYIGAVDEDRYVREKQRDRNKTWG